jgi:hypothetical protein
MTKSCPQGLHPQTPFPWSSCKHCWEGNVHRLCFMNKIRFSDQFWAHEVEVKAFSFKVCSHKQWILCRTMPYSTMRHNKDWSYLWSHCIVQHGATQIFIVCVNRPLGVPVQLWRCCINLQLELLKCPAELPVNWHSLTLVGYVGSFNCISKPVFIKTQIFNPIPSLTLIRHMAKP